MSSLREYSWKKLADYNSEGSFGFKLRAKRAERIKSLIRECYNENKKVSIIDIGGLKEYWKIISDDFLKENNVHITIVNLPNGNLLPENNELFTYLEGDGCNLSEFEDNSFHIAHSNSVIEHVGEWSNMVAFAKELKRVANKYYVQTPNYWFPIEQHFFFPFFHWLPQSMRIKLCLNMGVGWYRKAKNLAEAESWVKYCNLLTSKKLITLFPDGSLYREYYCFFVKSLIIVKK